MIVSRETLTILGLGLKLSDHVTEADDVPFKGSTSPIVDLGMYELKDLITGEIKPKKIVYECLCTRNK